MILRKVLFDDWKILLVWINEIIERGKWCLALYKTLNKQWLEDVITDEIIQEF